MPPRVLVALATYNERDNLAALLRAIRRAVPGADVLVVDDASPDGTGRLADELAAADSRLHVVHRSGKLGLGSALLLAMRRALAHDYDYVVTLDADFSHHPRFLPNLLAGMNNHDVMIGSRYVHGGGIIGWPWSRHLLSRAVNLLCRLLLGMPVRDASGGFRCYRVALLRRVALDRLISCGYSFQEELLYHLWRAGARLGEAPILFENRRRGSSKVDVREAVRSLSILAWLGVRRFFRDGLRPPLRGG
ncbi:MAG: polyprenol monophosphomannose synthase [Gemmataceae bacterium]|nr:polyprenol monophosphomannose synthase [Gemmataceae bacterium]